MSRIADDGRGRREEALAQWYARLEVVKAQLRQTLDSELLTSNLAARAAAARRVQEELEVLCSDDGELSLHARKCLSREMRRRGLLTPRSVDYPTIVLTAELWEELTSW